MRRLYPKFLGVLNLLMFLSFTSLAQIPTSGLIAYYPFTGNAADSSGSGRNGVVENATLTTDRFGRNGRAYFFDSDNDKITITNWGQITGNSPRTISLWFKTSNINVSQYLLSWGINNTNQSSIIGNYFGSPNNYFGYLAYSNDTYVNSTNTNPYFEDSWHNIIVTHNGTVTKLFVDGELKNTKTTSYATGSSNLYFGSLLGVGAFYRGVLDDIRIYNRALTDTETLSLYNTEVPKIVVGYTALDATVGENGEARAGISINVPKGTLIQPNLQLVYNSQGGNGLQGLGWSLDGIFQSINRLPATLTQDGFSDPVDFDDNDKFALNGERLMVINGVYGANGAEYRTEQNIFSKIISYGNTGKGPEKFKVWTKDGLTLEFGYNPTSRIETANSTTEVIVWLLNRIEDRKGNYLTITYQEDNTKGEFQPLQIDYTGNSRTGALPYNSIKFLYEDRPDFYSKRLSVIESYDQTTLFRKYVLSYDDDRIISKLTKITEFGVNGEVSFKATNITWSELPTNPGFIKSGSGTWTTPSLSYTFPGDFNADGLSDVIGFNTVTNTFGMVCLSDGKKFTGNQWTIDNTNLDWTKGILGDYNSDGKTDIALATAQGTKVCLSNGVNGFTCSYWSNLNLIGKVFSGDFNADGRTDILGNISTDEDIPQYYLLNSSGNSFTPNSIQGFGIPIDQVVGDFNGDGKTDILGYYINYDFNLSIFTIALSTGTGFTYKLVSEASTFFRGSFNRMTGDFNGDGRLDLAYSSSINNGYWTVLFSTDSGFKTGYLQGSWFSANAASRAFAVDLNGDGLTDIVGHDNNYFWTAAYSRGNTTEYRNNNWTSPTIPTNQPVYWADFDGDGATDWVLKTSNTQWSVNLSNINRQLVTQITTGHGATYKFDYSPLTDKSVYTKGDTATFPNADYVSAIYVVKQISTDDGSGKRQKLACKYKGATLNLRGRGFLGFTVGEMSDSSANIITKTVYSRDQNCRAARIKNVERRTFDGKLLQFNEYESEVINQGNGVCFSYYKTTTEHSYELNGVERMRKKTDQTFDTFGNVLELKVTYKNGYQIITNNDYTNDIVNWKLGRLTNTTVSKIKVGKPTITKNSSFGYDSDGFLNQEIILPSHTSLKLQTDYLFDTFGNRRSTTISGPNIVSRTDIVTYDAKGRFVVSATNALGHTTNFSYINGYLASTTDPNQLIVRYERDAVGREIRVLYPDGTSKTTQYKFCDAGSGCPTGVIHYIQEQVTGKGITRTYIDSLDRIKRSEKQGFDGRKIWVDNQYNKLGQQVAESDEYYQGDTPQWQTTEYDAIQRSTKQISPGNRIVTQEYSTINYRGEVLSLTKTTNFEGQNSWEAENELGKKIFTVNHLSDTLWFEYDNDLNLVATQDPKGNRITAIYNIRDFKTSMLDPDMRTYTYVYNTLGLLTSQTNIDNQVTTFEYNLLNELTKRIEPEGTSTWEYHTGSYGIGKLSKVFQNGQTLEWHRYDVKGRPTSVIYYREGKDYSYNYTYNATTGFLEDERYPISLVVRYIYNQYGYLSEVRNQATNALFWKANALNAKDMITSAQLGNNLVTNRTYNTATWYLERITAGTTTQLDKVQDYRYTYSALGNLTSRKEYFDGALGNRTETFEYDMLNRLKKTNGPVSVSLAYDALGNITNKSDVGNYRYGENNTGPHVLTSIDHQGITVNSTLSACTYPFNQGIQLTSFNYVSLLSNNQKDSLKFIYGAGRERIVQVAIKGGKTKWTKHYVGGKYEKMWYPSANGNIYDEIFYIQAGGEIIAFIEKVNKGINVTNIHYIHNDQLGSMSVLTDQNGDVKKRISHDSWGRARDASTWQPFAAPPELQASQRGFTFHEMLDMDWLICMNARIYDPISGRFLTPDPIIQFPSDLQSYNRYSYVGNNPLSRTDPSGHSWFSKLFKKIIGTVIGLAVAFYMPAMLGTAFTMVVNGVKVVNLAGAIVTGVASGFAGSFVGALANGAGFGGAIQAGVQGGIYGGINGAATFGIGSLFTTSAGQNFSFLKSSTHGLSQGLISKAQGGAFSSGFWSGFIGSETSVGSGGPASLGEMIVAGTVGGTVSDLTGGDFANGAVSGAFIYLFNEHGAGHNKDKDYCESLSSEIFRASKDYCSNIFDKIPFTDIKTKFACYVHDGDKLGYSKLSYNSKDNIFKNLTVNFFGNKLKADWALGTNIYKYNYISGHTIHNLGSAITGSIYFIGVTTMGLPFYFNGQIEAITKSNILEMNNK